MIQETHSEFIQIGEIGAFIDGTPDTCQHEYKDEVFITASGKEIHWHTFRQWASLTAPMRNDLIYKWSVENDDPIVCATSECRKCHKIYSPPIWDI